MTFNQIVNNEVLINDDWGWFIDIDYESKPQLTSNIKKLTFNTLKTIDEDDEYYYHKNNFRDFELDELQCHKNIEVKEQKDHNLIYKVGSSTLLTVLLSCIIYFIL